MLNCLFNRVALADRTNYQIPWPGLLRAGAAALCTLALLAVVTGCDTSPPPSAMAAAAAASAGSKGAGTTTTNSDRSLVLQEGDTVRITFAAAHDLDRTETVRRDGKITLETIGEYDAAGKTPAEMEQDLKKLYSKSLVNSDVSVTVEQSAFEVYVMGAVAKPGKVVSDRPMTVLEALIEAGVDDTKSNLKAVQIIRTDSQGVTTKTKLNLQKAISSKYGQLPSFTLKPRDVIYVPERFNLF